MGWGQWEEGITGTTIKDTWTKPRGRMEARDGGGFGWGLGEWWGEKKRNHLIPIAIHVRNFIDLFP